VRPADGELEVDSVTALLKPLTLVIVSVDVFEAPLVNVTEDGAPDTSKSGGRGPEVTVTVIVVL
jgi:hypothetical protein